jgi:hypothetical protein
VPATGAQRHVRGLVAMGHSYSRISRALGCHFETVQRLARGDVATVPAPLRADVTRLYEAWWDKRPPERTKGERSAAEASRQRAAQAGWCTGAGLDDARIDDPSYVPQASWRRAEGTGIAPEDPLGKERAHTPAQEGGPTSAAQDQEERMQENEAGSWLARDGDGRVLEVDADGHPGREASPDDGRPVAEAADSEVGHGSWLESQRATIAAYEATAARLAGLAERTDGWRAAAADRMARHCAEVAGTTARLQPPEPEAEAG